jgi:hypothetical protein
MSEIPTENNNYFTFATHNYSILTEKFLQELYESYPEKIVVLLNDESGKISKLSLNNYIMTYSVTPDSFDPLLFNKYISTIREIFRN